MAQSRLTDQTLAEEIGRRTGHEFLNPERLERALTHASARKQAGGANYERLEFLGDRVLGLIVAEMLFRLYPAANEGELSVRLNQLVDAETCSAVAEEIGLPEFILTGTEIKSMAGRKRMSMRADVMESVIATMYLDGGLDAVRPFIESHWAPRATAEHAGRNDAKTALQEWAHTRSTVPVYSVMSREGPDHDPLFTVRVVVEGAGEEIASGRSKRNAERAAAQAMLYRAGVWKRPEDGQE